MRFEITEREFGADLDYQTIELLGVIALNRVLVKNWREVRDARRRQAWTDHLRKELRPTHNPRAPDVLPEINMVLNAPAWMTVLPFAFYQPLART